MNNGGTLSTFFSNAIGILSAIGPTNPSYAATNPFAINMLDQNLIGYSVGEYNIGIGSTEFASILQAKNEFYNDYYNITDY